MHGEQNDDLTDGEARALLELVDTTKTLLKLTHKMGDDRDLWSAVEGLRCAMAHLIKENKIALEAASAIQASAAAAAVTSEIDAKFSGKKLSLFRNILRETSALYHLPDGKEKKE